MRKYYQDLKKKVYSFSFIKRLKKVVDKPLFSKLYLVVSIVILLLTTLLWSIMGAKLEQNNADQLVNPYLFSSAASWHQAILPDQHSFLIKWPLFLIIRLLNYSNASYITLTVLSVVLTVAILAYIIYRIDKRPLVYGTIVLALSSVLLLVPAQPYAGGILPVNMAMLTTRNLEYVIYIGAILLLLKSKKYLSRGFILAVVLLALLVASDKLFMSVTIAGSLLALFIYSFKRRWKMTAIANQWFLLSVISSLIGLVILWLINASHFAIIASGSLTGPYTTVSGSKSFLEGIFYAIGGLLTNFGANPGYNALSIRTLPSHLFSNLFSVSGPAYIVNLLILVGCLFIGSKLILNSIFSKNTSNEKDPYYKLALLMLWSTITVIVLFVISDHYYVVDSRYLTLALFALFISLAVWLSYQKIIDPVIASLVGLILLVSIIFGVFGSIQTHNSQANAYGVIQARDTAIVTDLKGHPVKYLVGDYWRVIPIKHSLNTNTQTIPLEDCTDDRGVLTSKLWQPNLRHTSFAYLLTINGSLTNFPSCNVKQVISAYGLPSNTTLIAGTLGKPDELLLFYDNGSHHPVKHKPTAAQISGVVTPTPLSGVTNNICSGPTIMNIVAHEDDDILFMNPDLYNEIKSGYCIRTIYVTAGNDGQTSFYWLSRERGAEAAYSYMLGSNQHWIERVVQLPDGQYISIDQPFKNTTISLIFMHLPDGNLKGDGFPIDDNQSIAKLYSGEIKKISTVDKQSTYTASQLVDGLADLMGLYLPTTVQTQADYVSGMFPDHSDHITTGQFATEALKQFEQKQYDDQVSIPIRYYIGYPIHQFPANVSGNELTEKEQTFMAYAQFDSNVCHSLAQCNSSSDYGIYLKRQYQYPLNNN